MFFLCLRLQFCVFLLAFDSVLDSWANKNIHIVDKFINVMDKHRS